MLFLVAAVSKAIGAVWKKLHGIPIKTIGQKYQKIVVFLGGFINCFRGLRVIR